MTYQFITVPVNGEKISISGGKLSVPDHPILPFVEMLLSGRHMERSGK
jgi:isocitrate dehydrogenase